MENNADTKGIDIGYEPLADKPGEDVVDSENAYHKKIKAVIEHNKRFLINYEPAMQQWYKQHKGPNGKSPNPPVYKDKDGKYFWANHRMRKAMARDQRRKTKKAKNNRQLNS